MIVIQIMKKKLLNHIFKLLFFIIALIYSGCDTDKYNAIPNVYVNISLHRPTDLADLGVGTFKTIQGGVGGIIIYRELPDLYRSFDRTCTYEPEHDCTVLVADTISFPTCPCCDSEFIIELGGMPREGSKAKLSLKEYQTTLRGDFVYITNGG